MAGKSLNNWKALEAAREYAKMGWATFPLCPGTKIPIKDSHAFLDASTDEEVLEQLFNKPDMNIGIRTGMASGIVVIDIDRHEGSADGFESIQRLKDEGFILPKGNMVCGAATARTPSGGLHIYYAAPTTIKIQSSVAKLAPAIDVKAESGSIIAPPTILANGNQYIWDRRPEKLMPLPEWVAERCELKPPPPRKQFTPTLRSEMPEKVRKIIHERLDVIASAPEGQRNAVLNQQSFYLAKYIGQGITELELEDMLLDAASKIQISHIEARRTVTSALSSARKYRSCR